MEKPWPSGDGPATEKSMADLISEPSRLAALKQKCQDLCTAG